MKRIIVYISLLPILWLGACCFNTKCDVDNGPPVFRVVNALNGKDMVLGPDAVYSRDDVRFYSLSAGDTVSYTWTTGAYSGAADSFIAVDFFRNKPARLFLRLSAADTDTLDLNYTTTSSRCCGPFTAVSSISYNNMPAQAVSSPVTLYK